MSNDGFVDLVPANPTADSPCTMTCTEMSGRKVRRVSLSFRLALLDDETAAIVRDGPRFNVAFNPQTSTFRITASDMGTYQTMVSPLSKGQTHILRFPPPPGMVFVKQRCSVEVDTNAARRTLLIDLPQPFRADPPEKTEAPPPVAKREPPRKPFIPPLHVERAPLLAGDPAPVPSASDPRR